MKKWMFGIILIGIFYLAFFLRFYNLSHIPPGIHGDEAEEGLVQQKVIKGEYDNFFSLGHTEQYFSFSVLSYYVQGIFPKIFGENAFGIRSSSAFAGVLTVIAFFFLSRLLFKNIFINLIITLALTTSHWHIAYSRLIIVNNWTPLFMVTILYFFFRGFLKKNYLNLFTAGILMGISLYFQYTTRVIPFIFLLFILIQTIKNVNFFKKNYKGILLIIITAGIIFLPQANYYFQNQNAFMSRMDTVSIFNHLPEYFERYHVKDVFGVLFWQFVNTLKVFNFGGDIGFYFYGYQGGLLAPIVGIFAFIGFLISFIKIKEDKHLFFIIWFFTTIILGGTITIDAPSSQRLVGLIPVLFLFAGVALEQLIKHKIHYLKTILVILFIINGFWDYKIYFKDYINSQAGWAQKEPATQIAYYLKSLGLNWKVYMLREGTWLYFHHGTIRFLNPKLEGVDIDNSEDVFRVRATTNKNIVYVMPPKSPSLVRLQVRYPNGRSIRFFNPIGNTPSFDSFEVKKSNRN